MIHIEQGQTIFEHSEFIVLDPTGDYNNDDLILCAHKDNPTEPYSKFEAQYVGYGGMVYKITDEAQLLKEIQDIDPSTLIDIPSIDQVQAVDPFTQTVSEVTPTEPAVATPTEPAPYFAPTEPVAPSMSTTTPTSELLNSTTTSPLPTPEATVPVSTTTPEIILPPELPPEIIPEATTTPVIEVPVVEAPITIPEPAAIIDTATTTP